MSRRRQSRDDRLRRLAVGACPVHGAGMTMTGDWTNDGRAFVQCRWKTCSITGLMVPLDAPGGGWNVTLLPQWVHLLDGEPA
jgi:hypothetical protein